MINFYFVAFFFLCGMVGTIMARLIITPIDKILTDKLIRDMKESSRGGKE